uniref:CARD domain-containing protein n=1 Tax=Strigamia maritima TaxID=126957 RepID=T1J863_STRMM
MAPTSPASLLLERYKESLTRDVNILHFLPELVQKGVFSNEEEAAILRENNVALRTETFLDFLSKKDLWAFQEVYKKLERLSPHFTNRYGVANAGGRHEDKAPSQALKMGFELALKERDAVLREKAQAVKERDDAWYRYTEMKDERDRALANLDNLATNNRQSMSRLSRTSLSLQDFTNSRNSPVRIPARGQNQPEIVEADEDELLDSLKGH